MLRVWRTRKSAMMMARPTAASAAATTITKKTKIWPETWCHMCANATNVRLTALSISSIDMKMVITLRLIRNAAMPMENRMAARMRYQAIGTMLRLLPREYDRAENRHEDQHRSDLKRQQ